MYQLIYTGEVSAVLIATYQKKQSYNFKTILTDPYLFTVTLISIRFKTIFL